MLASLAWRGNLHQSAVQSLLVDEIAAPTSSISLLSASSNGLLVETRLLHQSEQQQEQQIQELHHRVIFDGGRMNPVFCLLAARDLVFAGMAKNEVRAWRRWDCSPVDVDMKGHTGWVRGIAVHKNLLFTAACNFVKVWELRGTFDDDGDETGTIMDVSYIGDIKLFKGDILCLAVSSSHLYCGTADGFLHSWQLPAAAATEDGHSKLRSSSFAKPRTVQAHNGRITSLLFHEGTLHSAGKDGYIRSWSTNGEFVENSSFASGQKLRALAAGHGCLFFAGDEALGSISPSLSLNGLQTLHRASTKSLARRAELLASGGADGEVRLWKILAPSKPT